MSRARFPWNRLGIDETSDVAAIRKAYADALRATNVDEDIAGYAELRRARDEALWLAAQAQLASGDGDDYGLGDLDGGDDDQRGDGAAGPSASDYDGDDDAYDDDDDWMWDECPATQHPDPLARAPDHQLTNAQRRAQAAWQAIRDLLYPDGAPSDESVTYAELEQGLAQLDVILARAGEADLLEHDAIDGALADLFASTWPRSAPFVEAANAAFHWLEEAGSLEERPALRFLNQRLKGMRFHDKVQLPSHPLHKAWTELSRPGQAAVWDRLRVKRLEVDKLLTGVREHYPELESYLDPARVASWEAGGGLRGNPGGRGPSVVRWIFVAVMVGSVLARLGGSLSDSGSDADKSAQMEAFAKFEEVEADLAAAQVFGQGTDMAAVRAADPVFADQLRGVTNGMGAAEPIALAFVRLKALTSAAAADFDALVTRAELRRLWITATEGKPPALCQNINAGDFTSIPLPLSDKQRAREQALLRKLLDAKALSRVPQSTTVSYTIPGWLVGEVISRSKLGDAAVRKAMGDAKDPNRCAVDGLMLDSVLASPGRVSKELLMSM